MLLTFIVDTFWPDGGTNRVYQRISFAWELRKDKPLIHCCHISNAIDYDVRDNIYPVHYLENHNHMVLYSGNPQKLYFKGVQKSILFTGPDQIIYMESIGNHTMIHMTTQSFECTERLNAVVERMQGSMLRCHSSYLVNPMYVESIERFALTLSDGSRIPIPEKKYTAVKDLLLHK